MTKSEVSAWPTGPRERWTRDHYRYFRCKAPEDLPDNWESIMVSEMGQGAGRYELMVILEIGKKTWEHWYKTWPHFKEVVDDGVAACQGWWEHVGRANLANPRFQSNLWTVNMQHRFKWVQPKASVTQGEATAQEALGALNEGALDDLFAGGDGTPKAPQKNT